MKKILWEPNNNEGNLLTFGKGAYGSKNSAANLFLSLLEKKRRKKKNLLVLFYLILAM